ncbi:ProQ/FinO family protein [Caballeronia humi]|uniref:ProP effector n=1 Tax=Caballeronia humi TaxID=326474 RepID=A0A158JF02_9BURK|nr:ProQ/FinO family protein [Caballeronia humi]SAL67444.1 ProP effector [Caballeronia humi]
MGFEQLVALKAQLNQGAKGKKAASRLTSAPVRAGREINQSPKAPRTSADAAARAVTMLQRHFPHAFPHSRAPKVPLKVGILKDVLAHAASLGLSDRDARNGVKLWCRGQRYWTCLVEGNVRVDLTGANTGVVSAAEADYGASQEKIRLARRREQIDSNRQGQPR